MLRRFHLSAAALVALAVAAGSLSAAEGNGLKKGTPDLKSAGALAFGPDGILFIGDSMGAAVFAIDTGDRGPAGQGGLKVERIDEKIGAMLGATSKDVVIGDLAVNPLSGNAYISLTRGQGANAVPALVKVDRSGKITDIPLKDIPFAKASLANAATSERQRKDAITQLGYVKGRVFVAGLSNEEFASKLRAIPFPFTEADRGTSVEIWHSAHGKFETQSPVRTFVPYDVNGESCLLAAYTCTPLVKFPVEQLKPGQKIMGTTIAELGNGNVPLDMLVYEKDGKNFLLLTNNRRGVMKIPTDGIEKVQPLNKTPVPGGGTAGLPYETVKSIQGVQQMAKLDAGHALVLVRSGAGALNLETIELP